jgi:hypothetical protein
LRRQRVELGFSSVRRGLGEVLADHGLASLGDAYVNFVFSLAISNRKREPMGIKVKGTLLAEALRRAGLRECLPSRMSRHKLADAAEALIVYTWLNNSLSLGESIALIGKYSDPVEGLSQLLVAAKERTTFP